MNPLVSASKFTSPPTIADYARHQAFLQKVSDSKAKELLDLEASAVPLQLQAFTNIYSLKPTAEEKNLQDAVQSLPRAGMVGAPDEANFLCMLLEMMKAKTVVEIGVFRGVTTLALAQCLQKMNPQDSKVYGLDVSSEYAEIGQKHWKLAGVQDRIDLRIGDAKESLSELLTELGENSVDMCFIDADKSSYGDYYEKSVRLCKSGGLIVVDNTLWGGMVALPDEILASLTENASQYSSDDTSEAAMLARRALDTIAIKELAARIHADERIERVSFLTIADGVTICRKK